jgi:quercetin dioxygenase-like cupin family protein
MHTNHPVSTSIHEVLDVLGPTVEFLTPPSEAGAVYCVMKGTIPAGVSVPLHSHPDPESFFVLSGYAQALTERGNHLEWLDVKPGDFVHIPGGTKHAHRNVSNEPVVELITTTPALGRFFQEIGRPIPPDAELPPPTGDQLQEFVRAAVLYRHWLGSAAENAAVGIALP